MLFDHLWSFLYKRIIFNNLISDVEGWFNNAFDTAEYLDPRPELYLQPVALYKDPFRKGNHKIVYCELLYPSDKKPVGMKF